MPELQRALLRNGSELIIVADDAVHMNSADSAEENHIFLTLRMRQSEAVFVVEANRVANVSEVAEYVARRLLASESRHYKWTFTKERKALSTHLSLTMAGLKSGDDVLLTGNHKYPQWAPNIRTR